MITGQSNAIWTGIILSNMCLFCLSSKYCFASHCIDEKLKDFIFEITNRTIITGIKRVALFIAED
jgi:hypothetical protein